VVLKISPDTRTIRNWFYAERLELGGRTDPGTQ
jgi:hypothetical protein